MKKIFFCSLFASLLLFSCSRSGEWRSAGGAAWGTTYHITYLSSRDLSDSVVAVMRGVELAVSTFEPQSVISRVNRRLTDTVSPMFAEIFRESRRVSAASRGAFDPTVMPLVNLWGFGYRDSLAGEEPDSALIARTLASVGIDACSVSPDLVLTRKSPSTEFDFSAIAKGYGVDCVADMLRRNGCSDFMVEIGGEVAVSGLNRRGEDWRVMIDDPTAPPDRHRKLTILSLTDCAVATSGNYRNFRTLPDGSRVSHTISPHTGRPVLSSTLSVSVIAPRCVTADAFATACMAMPFSEARAMIAAQPGVSVLFVIDRGSSVDTVAVGPHQF